LPGSLLVLELHGRQIGNIFMQLREAKRMPHLPPEERDALIERSRQCDQEAFRRLWENYEAAVYGFIRSHLPYDNIVNYMLQHTREEAWKRKSKAEVTFYAWLTDQIAPIVLRNYWLEKLPLLILGYLLILHETTKVGGRPHQVLAYLFSNVLEYGPTRVVEELSEIPLFELARRAEEEYIEQSGLPPIVVVPSFQSLHGTMGKTVGEVNPSPAEAGRENVEAPAVPRLPQGPPPPPLTAIVGSTAMRDYYRSDDPKDRVAQWSSRVMQRVKRHFERHFPEWLEILLARKTVGIGRILVERDF
jgi:hypothetical protein